MSEAVLALDQGSHASRACLWSAEGQLLAQHSVPVATRSEADCIVEHDPLELAQSLRLATAAVLHDCDVQLVAVGLATQRSTLVCCRRSTLEPVSAALSWQDRRNDAWLRSLQPLEPRVRELTGLPLSPHYGASKFRWCLDHLPAVQAAQRDGDLWLLPLASYLCAALTSAAPVVDPANASRTLLWDARGNDWSPELLQLFGIPRLLLPDPTGTTGGFGTLMTARGAAPMVACTGDQSAVPFALDAPDSGAVYLNLGTGAFVQRPSAQWPAHAEPLLASVLSRGAAGDWYSLEGTVNGAGSALQWVCQRDALMEQELWPQLERMPQSAELPWFINGVGGLGSPWWRAQVTPRFVGAGSALQNFAAVVDSIALMIARNFGLLREFGRAPECVWAGGGISRSAWLCQRLANLLAVPVRQLPAEASALGVARLAAPELAARWPAPTGDTFLPRQTPALRARQQHFDQLMDDAAANSRSTNSLA